MVSFFRLVAQMSRSMPRVTMPFARCVSPILGIGLISVNQMDEFAKSMRRIMYGHRYTRSESAAHLRRVDTHEKCDLGWRGGWSESTCGERCACKTADPHRRRVYSPPQGRHC